MGGLAYNKDDAARSMVSSSQVASPRLASPRPLTVALASSPPLRSHSLATAGWTTN